MQLLFAARVGWFDLLRIVGLLASKVTKWIVACDKQLHRLMRYVQGTLEWRQIGYAGDSLEELVPLLFCDADFAGSKSDMRSTSGILIAMSGPSTLWLVVAVSRRQDVVSRSTLEAEMVAGAYGVRQKGLPFMHIVDAIKGEKSTLHMCVDNDAMILITKPGRNPTMRHMGCAHGISVSWMHEWFKGSEAKMHYCPTDKQGAAIFTNAFDKLDKWTHARMLITVVPTGPLLHSLARFARLLSCVGR